MSIVAVKIKDRVLFPSMIEDARMFLNAVKKSNS